jgi:hypothetical protein
MTNRHTETQDCPKCGDECWREDADVGVGIIYGPWGCPSCGWSESGAYDLSEGKSPIDEKGGVTDQFGMYYPPENSVARAYLMAAALTPTPAPNTAQPPCGSSSERPDGPPRSP